MCHLLLVRSTLHGCALTAIDPIYQHYFPHRPDAADQAVPNVQEPVPRELPVQVVQQLTFVELSSVPVALLVAPNGRLYRRTSRVADLGFVLARSSSSTCINTAWSDAWYRYNSCSLSLRFATARNRPHG
jgi:hypothetical protein